MAVGAGEEEAVALGRGMVMGREEEAGNRLPRRCSRRFRMREEARGDSSVVGDGSGACKRYTCATSERHERGGRNRGDEDERRATDQSHEKRHTENPS